MGILDRLSIKPFTVVSHRTAAGVKPENSISGIEYSIMVGADIVEMDVRSTRDGVLILFHDEDMARLFNIEKRIRDVSYEWLNKNVTLSSGEPVPTLEEALEKGRGRIGFFIEVKEPDTTRDVVETLLEKADPRDAAIISFYDEALTTASKTYPDITTGLIYFKPPGRIFDAKKLGARIVLPQYRIATVKANKLAHRLKLKVVAWTVNDEETAVRAVERGVDGVATDYPEKLVRLRRGFRGQ